MAMNIEQRLEQSAKSIEQSSQKAHDFAEKDTTLQTCAGSRDSLPKVSRIWQENFARQMNQHATEFQDRFALSQQSLPWQAGITISDSLQRYHVGVQGEEGYKEFLPNPVKLPFETSSTLAEDLTQERWLENGVPNKHWTESKLASALEKSLGVNARIWPKRGDLQVGDVIPAPEDTSDGLPITHLVVNGNAYAISPLASGLVSGLNATGATIGSVEVVLYVSTHRTVPSAMHLKTINGTSGEIVQTLGYWGGFLGSAYYKHFESEDVVDFQKAKDIADEIGGGFTQPGGGVWVLMPDDGGVVNPYQFGVLFDNDGNQGVGHDNHQNLQAMVNYCSPFVWKGSVSETKKHMGKVRARVIGGFGYARHSLPIMINPFFNWEGLTVGGFFESSGTVLVADFDSNINFALDTAPYNASGVRPLGGNYSRFDFDDGNITGSMGQRLTCIKISPASGRSIRGGINRAASQQSFFTNNSITGFDIGIFNSSVWSGSVTLNHIRAKTIGIYNGLDSTVDDQESNYITRAGVTSVDFVWPATAMPDSLAKKTTGIWNRFSAISPKNNIIEGFDHMFKGEGNDVRNLDSNYAEKIQEFIYVIYGSYKTRIVCDNLRSPSAQLINIVGPSDSICDIDLSATQLVDLAGWGVIDINKINVTGLIGTENGLKAFNGKVNLLDRQGVKTIYVSPSGSDLHWGFANSPVYTLQGALERVNNGDSATIIIPSGAEITTKYGFKDGNVSDRYLDNVDITIKSSAPSSVVFGKSFEEVHALPLSDSKIRWENVSLKASARLPTDNEMRQCHRFYGVCSINLLKCVALNITVAGVRTKASATVFLESYKTDFINCEMTQGNMLWTENNAESTFGASVQGTGAIKLASKQFN